MAGLTDRIVTCGDDRQLGTRPPIEGRRKVSQAARAEIASAGHRPVRSHRIHTSATGFAGAILRDAAQARGCSFRCAGCAGHFWQHFPENVTTRGLRPCAPTLDGQTGPVATWLRWSLWRRRIMSSRQSAKETALCGTVVLAVWFSAWLSGFGSAVVETTAAIPVEQRSGSNARGRGRTRRHITACRDRTRLLSMPLWPWPPSPKSWQRSTRRPPRMRRNCSSRPRRSIRRRLRHPNCRLCKWRVRTRPIRCQSRSSSRLR